MKEISLSFVNEGKPFIMPGLTVKNQENILKKLSEIDKKGDEETTAYEMNKYLVFSSLKEIDKTVTMKEIENMHPTDFSILFRILWKGGRELKDDDTEDFQKAE